MKTEKPDTQSIIALAASIREQANTLIVQFLSEQGVTNILPAHGAVLNALFKKSPMLMSELAKAIGRKKNTVTGLINTLEERGICYRESNPLDARIQHVLLTEKGEAMREIQADVSKQLLNLIWQGISKQDQQICVQVLSKVLSNLEAQTLR